MAQLRDILFYILANYPEHRSGDLSNTRVSEIVYLADWKHVLDHGRQISNIKWRIGNYGPYVEDIINLAKEERNLFSIKESANYFGNKKYLISLITKDFRPSLASSERGALEHTLKQTGGLNFEDFVRLVYSTYPVANSEKYTQLDLSAQAEQYQRIRRM